MMTAGRGSICAAAASEGLGLPLVKAFIEMHGGQIEIVREVDESTTVSLFFPPERTRTS
jgi:signal transduction histidine kinase